MSNVDMAPMTRLQQRIFAWFCLFATIPSTALAGGFALFSKHEELKGHAVIEAGDFEKIDPPFEKLGGREVLRLGVNCFEAIGILGLWGPNKKAGLIVVDRARSIKVALIESGIGDIKIEVVPVVQVACPTSESDGLPQDPQQLLQELKRRQEALQKELERLRQKKQ